MHTHTHFDRLYYISEIIHECTAIDSRVNAGTAWGKVRKLEDVLTTAVSGFSCDSAAAKPVGKVRGHMNYHGSKNSKKSRVMSQCRYVSKRPC